MIDCGLESSAVQMFSREAYMWKTEIIHSHYLITQNYRLQGIRHIKNILPDILPCNNILVMKAKLFLTSPIPTIGQNMEIMSVTSMRLDLICVEKIHTSKNYLTGHLGQNPE